MFTHRHRRSGAVFAYERYRKPEHLALVPDTGTRYNVAMRVIKRSTLSEYSERYANARDALWTWFYDAKAANWTCPSDVKKTHISASIIDDRVVVFNIKGGQYRLVVRIEYEYHFVFIRWFGTHQEYDRIDVRKV